MEYVLMLKIHLNFLLACIHRQKRLESEKLCFLGAPAAGFCKWALGRSVR